MSVRWIVRLPITLHRKTHWHTVYIVPTLWRPCILGNDFIRSHNLQIDAGRRTTYFRNTTSRKFLHSPHSKYFFHPYNSNSSRNRPYQLSSKHHSNSLLPLLNTISSTRDSNIVELPNLPKSILSPFQQNALSLLIQSFPQLFTHPPGRTNKSKHHIDLTPNTKPRNSVPYRYSPARRKIIDTLLDEMLLQRVIVPSKSPWASS